MTPIFQGTYKDGKLHIVNRKGFATYLSTFNGLPFELIARKPRKARTTNQNNYYWGIVLALISQTTGHEPDELHEAFKRKFLTKHNEHGLEFVQSTTELSTADMVYYVEQVRRFAAMELETIIPDPNEVENESAHTF
jgi:hypothetical protein